MAFFAVVAWRSGRSPIAVVRGGFSGLAVGVFCWTLCAWFLGGALGGVLLTPAAFGVSLGLASYLYVRKKNASPLLVPAIIAGTIVGNIVMTASLPLVLCAIGLLTPDPASGAFAVTAVTAVALVAIPAYSIHLAYQLVEAAVGRPAPE